MGLVPVEANKIDRGGRSKHRRDEALQGRGVARSHTGKSFRVEAGLVLRERAGDLRPQFIYVHACKHKHLSGV